MSLCPARAELRADYRRTAPDRAARGIADGAARAQLLGWIGIYLLYHTSVSGTLAASGMSATALLQL
jgi:hypothetical protein